MVQFYYGTVLLAEFTAKGLWSLSIRQNVTQYLVEYNSVSVRI